MQGKGVNWISWSKITRAKSMGGLGIRDFKAFNVALLAKQSWRMIQRPSSLLARVFKAKYYAKTDLLNASQRYNSSHAWKSIIQGNQLIKTGLRWNVGNGKSINVWTDAWIPTSPPKPASGPSSITHPNLRVSDLFIPMTTQWDQNKLYMLIQQNDRGLIRQIYPPMIPASDVATWTYTKDGSYTVKSGYHLAHSFLNAQLTPQNHSPTIYKALWNIDTQPKIKHFWWKILNNALPVASNLKQRRMLRDPLCQLCGQTEETINHLFFQCRVTKEIWELSSALPATVPDIIMSAAADYEEWKTSKSQELPSRTETPVQPKFTQYPASLDQLQHKLTTPYFCFVDASWLDKYSIAGYGWSLHKSDGSQILQGTGSLPPRLTSHETEVEALRQAVTTLRTLWYRDVTFVGDLRHLYDPLRQSSIQGYSWSASHHPQMPLIRDILHISKQQNFKFHSICRDLNKLADHLAKLARLNVLNHVIRWSDCNNSV